MGMSVKKLQSWSIIQYFVQAYYIYKGHRTEITFVEKDAHKTHQDVINADASKEQLWVVYIVAEGPVQTDRAGIAMGLVPPVYRHTHRNMTSYRVLTTWCIDRFFSGGTFG